VIELNRSSENQKVGVAGFPKRGTVAIAVRKGRSIFFRWADYLFGDLTIMNLLLPYREMTKTIVGSEEVSPSTN